MDTIVFTNSSSFDETLVYDWCDLNLIPTGSVKVVDVSQKINLHHKKIILIICMVKELELI